VSSEGGVVGRSGQGTEIDHKGLNFLVAIGVGQAPFSGRTSLFQLQSISYEGLFLFGQPGRGQDIGQGGYTGTFVGGHDLLAYY